VAEWAERMGMAAVQRLWQLLLRAHDEVARAADPLTAAEMALLRIAHASTMPDPDELARLLAQGGGAAMDGVAAAAPVAAPAPVAIAPAPVAAIAKAEAETETESEVQAPPVAPESGPAPPVRPAMLTLEAVAALLSDSGELMLGSLLRREGRLVSVEPGLLRLQRGATIGEAQAQDLAGALSRADQAPWRVELADAGGAPTLGEQAARTAAEAEAQLRAHPVIAAALTTFPDAELLRAPRDATRH